MIEGWIYCGWGGRELEKEEEKGEQREAERRKKGMKEVTAWSCIDWIENIYIFVPNKDRHVLWEDWSDWGAKVQTKSVLNWTAIYYSSKSNDSGPHLAPLIVYVTLWVREGVKEFCVFALPVQTVQSHLFVSRRQKPTTQPHSRRSSAWNHIRPRYELSHRGKSE